MKPSLLFAFLASVLAAASILMSISFDPGRLALNRLDTLLQREVGLKEMIASHCASTVGKSGSSAEKYFLERYATKTPAGSKSCSVTMESASTTRFRLHTYWNFLVKLEQNGGSPFFERNYRVECPEPLTLLPFAIFLLALVFEFSFWGFGCTLATYLFLLAGGNFIAGVNLGVQSLKLALGRDQTLVGLILMIGWLAIYRANHAKRTLARRQDNAATRWANRLFTLAIGLWNPVIYTAGARLIFPFKGAVSRAMPLLDAQFFVTCLSLYLLAFDFRNLREFAGGLLLPRYFTFTALLFTVYTYWSTQRQRQIILWHLPRFWRAVAFVVGMEVISYYVDALSDLPNLTRVSLALLASELVWPFGIEWKSVGKTFFPWGGTILLASVIVFASTQSGIADLAIALSEPRLHPSAVVFFTFSAGVMLGFLTGNFSTAFFAMFALMMKTSSIPLVRAALLDGILAGMMLSPFSLFNLLPAIQLRLPFQNLIKTRFRQIALPLAIGGLIYAVAGVNSVAILRPVTFVFLCLVSLAIRLKQQAWQVGDKINSNTLLPNVDSVAH